MSELYTSHEINDLINNLASKIKMATHSIQTQNIAMIGIHTGGSYIAKKLFKQCNISTPLGTLDISFYRDDFAKIGLHPQVKPSQIDFDVNDKTIILVDDIILSGRTIRAAMNEIFAYGRPAKILLICLVDRGQREVPIHPDFTALQLDIGTHKEVKLNSDLSLHLLDKNND